MIGFKKRLRSSYFLIHSINFLIFLIIVTYQACSQKYTLDSKSLVLPEKCEEGLCQFGELNPEFDQVRPPTKVLFVVDNSKTMELSQGYLANGVKSLATGLRGYDANFYIYSTSDKHQVKLDANGNPRFTDDKPVINSTPLKTCTWTELENGVLVTKTGSVCPNDKPTTYVMELLNLMNPNLGMDLNFKANFDEVKFNEMNNKLSEAIKGVGIDGSANETGLCTLVRSVYNESANSIFQKGDNAAMVVLSDENDNSTPQNCQSRTVQEEVFTGKPAEYKDCNPLIENCDKVEYKVNFSPVYANQKYAEVKMNYKCETMGTSNSCALNSSCDSVGYRYENLRSNVTYSCFSKIPYTISFNPYTSYKKSLKYQCDLYEDGVVSGTSDPNIIPLSGEVAPCSNGSEVVCDSTALDLAKTKCTGTNQKLNISSCKLVCNSTISTPSNIVYNDEDQNAPERDISNSSIISNWVSTNYPKYSIKTVVRGTQINSNLASAWVDLNCSSENTTGSDCTSGSIESTKAVSQCNGKAVVSCKKKCLKEPNRIVYLKNPKTEDVVDFCSNSDTAKKFTPSNSTILFSSIKEYVTKTLYSTPQNATLASCSRIGEKFSSVSQASLVNNTSKSSCDNNYSGIFNTSNLCNGTNPKQNGITPGSISYSCQELNKQIEIKPALVQNYTHLNSNAGQNICNQPFQVGSENYSSLNQYYMKLLNRTDTPSSCTVVSGKKLVDASGIISSSKTLKNMTFPMDQLSSNSNLKLDDSFHQRSKDLFGENGYFVSAIIRDEIADAQESNCSVLGADQSYGTKYRSVVEATTGNSNTGQMRGDITSICANDYSKALNSVTKWIKETTRRTYYIYDIKEGYELLSISFKNPNTGEETPLSPGLDYEVVGNKVNFINQSIDPKGSIIRYLYWMPKTEE